MAAVAVARPSQGADTLGRTMRLLPAARIPDDRVEPGSTNVLQGLLRCTSPAIAGRDEVTAEDAACRVCAMQTAVSRLLELPDRESVGWIWSRVKQGAP